MSQRPPFEAEAAIIGPVSNLVRRVEIFESDAITPWEGGDFNDRLIDGSVGVDYARAERRSAEVSFENDDRALAHNPDGFWYDKVLKVFTGVAYSRVSQVISYLYRTNLCMNPSFELSTANWYAGTSSTITRDTSVWRLGASSLRFDSSAAGAFIYTADCPVAVTTSVTVSIWARGTGTLQLEARGRSAASTTTVTNLGPVVTLSNAWTQYNVSVSVDTATTKVRPLFYQRSAGAQQMWIDGVTVVAGPTNSSIFNGATQNFANREYYWNGPPNFSTSTEKITIITDVIEDTIWEKQIGEFMMDSITEDHFPYTIKVTCRDYTKKCILSKFVNATSFAKGEKIEAIIKTIAQGAGVTKFLLPLTSYSLDADYFFERNSARWDAMDRIASSFGYELFFDSQGYLVMREFQDPVSAPLAYSLETGAYGTLVSFSKTVNDTRIFNHIIVTGESSDADTIPVMKEARNTEPSSPTRIDRIGDRVYQYSSAFITTEAQAADVAGKYLRIMGLEEFDLNFSSISLFWLDVGEIVEFNDPRENVGQPTRFLLSSLSIPLGLGAMSGNAKRVSVVS